MGVATFAKVDRTAFNAGPRVLIAEGGERARSSVVGQQGKNAAAPAFCTNPMDLLELSSEPVGTFPFCSWRVWKRFETPWGKAMLESTHSRQYVYGYAV